MILIQYLILKYNRFLVCQTVPLKGGEQGGSSDIAFQLTFKVEIDCQLELLMICKTIYNT